MLLPRSPATPGVFTPPVAMPQQPQRRKRIDQIPGKWHCSIIGTCLTLAELRKIAVKARFNLPPDASDYRIHGAVVHSCGDHKVLSRLVTKALDKRFPAHIARFSRAESEEALAELWRSHCDSGDVPGAYWALMSHPMDCPSLREHAYGEVHMLSHLSGASQRVDMRRQAELERALASRAGEVEALTAERARWREVESRLAPRTCRARLAPSPGGTTGSARGRIGKWHGVGGSPRRTRKRPCRECRTGPCHGPIGRESQRSTERGRDPTRRQ